MGKKEEKNCEPEHTLLHRAITLFFRSCVGCRRFVCFSGVDGAGEYFRAYSRRQSYRMCGARGVAMEWVERSKQRQSTTEQAIWIVYIRAESQVIGRRCRLVRAVVEKCGREKSCQGTMSGAKSEKRAAADDSIIVKMMDEIYECSTSFGFGCFSSLLAALWHSLS